MKTQSFETQVDTSREILQLLPLKSLYFSTSLDSRRRTSQILILLSPGLTIRLILLAMRIGAETTREIESMVSS